jgi:hypothetical protein
MERIDGVLREFSKDGCTLSEKARQSLAIASHFADIVDRPHIGPEHLLFGLAKSNSIATVLFSDSPNAERFLGQLKNLGSMCFVAGNPPHVRTAFDIAKRLANKKRKPTINCLELMLGVLIGALDSFKYLAMTVFAQHNNDINYTDLVARANQLHSVEPYIDNQQFLLTYDGKKFRMQPFSLLDMFHFDSSGLRESGSTTVTKANIVHHTGFLGEIADEMETIINGGDIEGASLQRLLESPPLFSFVNDWQMPETKVTLEAEEAQEADFSLETVDSQSTAVEPTKPNKKCALDPKNHQGGDPLPVVNTLSLLREYQDYFRDRNRRREFHERYGFNEFCPRLAGIIGRSHELDSYESQMSIQDVYQKVRLLTYGDVVNRAKRRRIIIDQILSMPDKVSPAKSEMNQR